MGEFIWRGRRYVGTHEPMLTRETWDAVQGTFNGQPALVKIGERNGAFAGFLRCAECGCQITYDPKRGPKGVYLYYRCANGKKHHERLTYVTETTIVEGFAPAVASIDLDPGLAKIIFDRLQGTHDSVRSERRIQAGKYRSALDELEGREDKLYDDLRTGRLDEAAYHRQLQRLRDDRHRFTELLEHMNDELDRSYLRSAQRILEIAIQAKTLWNVRSPSAKRELLDAILSNPRLRGESVEYELKKPFQALSEMAEGPDWRARKDSNFRLSVP